MAWRVGLWLGLAAVFAWRGVGAAEPARLALVIGNSVYAGLPALPSCAASMNVVSAALKRAGFAVTERLNPSNGTMGAAIGAFGDGAAAAGAGTRAVVYVCGYATEFDGRLFLLPASARLERETDALSQGLVARLLPGSLAGPEVEGGALLLDAVGLPGKGSRVGLDGLFTGLGPGVGAAGSYSRVTLAGGPTPLAAAVAAGLASPAVEVQRMLQDVRLVLDGSPGLSVVTQMPARPGWLVGQAASVPAPPPVAVAQPEAAAAVAPVAPQGEGDVRLIQASLRRLGYYAGRADGMMGPDTVAAIRRFQHEVGAAMTGRLTVEQAGRLLAKPQ